MADVEYSVLVSYQTSGSLSADLDKAHTKAGHLGTKLGEVSSLAGEAGSHLVEGFQHAVEHAAHLAAHTAKIAAALGIGAAAYGVTHLNAQLEQTTIGLAAVFKAVGFSSDFNKAFDMAGDQVNKMKTDIKALPGDLGNLSDIMMTIASPAGKAGASADQIRKMSGQALLAGTILNLPVDTIGRELGMIIGGTITHRMPLLQRMPGLPDAAAMRGMTPEQRLKLMQKAMDDLTADAAEKFSHSWKAVWTTMKDDLKYGLLATATQPLFEAVKGSIEQFNAWFDKNQDRLKYYATEVGETLAHAWTRGIELAQEWGPKLIEFARQLKDNLAALWTEMAPALERAAKALEKALGDGSALTDLKDILKVYAATKIGGSVVGGGLKVAGAMGPGGLAMAGEAIGAAGAGGPIAVGVAALAALGAYGEMSDLLNPNNVHHADAVKALDDLAAAASTAGLHLSKDIVGPMQDLAKEFGPIITELAAFGIKVEDVATTPLRAAARGIIDTFHTLGGGIGGLVDMINGRTHDLMITAPRASPFGGGNLGANPLGLEPWEMKDTLSKAGFGVLNWGLPTTAHKEDARRPGGGGGGGGTSVQKVEIIVNTNQDSGRVAEMVVDRIKKLNRHPRMSQYVPNQSSGGFGPGF